MTRTARPGSGTDQRSTPASLPTRTRHVELPEVLLLAADGQSVLDAFGRRITVHVTHHRGRSSSVGFEVRSLTLPERLAWALRPRPLTVERWRG